MLLSPQLAMDYGVITAPIRPFDDDQMQQNGVDVRVARIFRIPDTATLEVPGQKPDMIPMEPGIGDYYLLKPHCAYSILCHEYIDMPWHLGGEIIIRSTFNRNGVFGRSSWYDPGFKNFAGFTMFPFVNVRVKLHERVGQFICSYGQPATLYNGSYMDEAAKQSRPNMKMHAENDLETGE